MNKVPRFWPNPWNTPKGDPDVGYRNETGSIPANSYIDNYWLNNTTYVVWQVPSTLAEFGPLDRVLYRGVWQSTVLDLEPQFKGAMGPDPSAQGVRAGANMAIKINYTEITTQFRVFSCEYANLFDPALRVLDRVENFQDVTVDFCDPQINDTGSSIILTFRPVAATRYWRVSLTFDILEDYSGAEPPPVEDLPQIALVATSY